jgi:heme/copper-type cytochrome/quinol oxidase subunit 3
VNIFAPSNHIALAAIIGGMTSAGLNAVIADYVDVSIRNTQKFCLQTTFAKLFVSSFTVGLLLSVIFYAFAVYGYPNASMTPVQIIALFTLCFGLGYPILDMLMAMIRNKIFA